MRGGDLIATIAAGQRVHQMGVRALLCPNSKCKRPLYTREGGRECERKDGKEGGREGGREREVNGGRGEWTGEFGGGGDRERY